MLSLPSSPRARFGALLAVLALGTAGGLTAGCGGSDPDPVSDATVSTGVETPTPDGEVTTPTVTEPAATTETVPSTSSAPAQTTTAPGAQTTTVPGGAPSTAPADPGGQAAPDENAATTPNTTTNSGGGASAIQDPECRPGTGPGQRYPQCEPLTGPDAQENEG
jgi:hypothetical protein